MTLESVEADRDGFRAALGTFAASVNVITMWDREQRPLGMTATAFSSVSVDPLLVLVCINRSTRTYRYIAEQGSFGVNILGSAARTISDYCSQPGADKYLDPSWLRTDTAWSSPALAGALAFLDCVVEQDVQAGTHAVLIGEVKGIGLSDYARVHEPLVYFQGGYRPLQAKFEPRPAASLPILADDFPL
jgi:flavin reductase (DIM6/NTAB) family NADH-FMN oxidoreductase RutF